MHTQNENEFSLTTILSACLFVFLILTACSSNNPYMPDKDRYKNINNGWKFTYDSVEGAEIPDFNDSAWRIVDLPHDWSIEDLPRQDSTHIGPFFKNSIGETATGYTVGGTGWYRNKLIFDSRYNDKQIFIQFDGVYMESDVWVNGKHAGFHPYGYTPFFYNITPFLNSAGKPNQIAVRVVNPGKNSRWYSGSGIYRNVWLTVTNPVYVDLFGVFITTPEVSHKKATVKIEITTMNKLNTDATVLLKSELISPSGITISSPDHKFEILRNDKNRVILEITVENPELWNLDTPDLYEVIIELRQSGEIVDRYQTKFGIRSIDFSSEEGFLLNGKSVLLKGACLHHDNGLLGAASFTRAEIRKVEIMKANGYNAIRTSHNPPSQIFLDACDSLGMLVIDEIFDMWERPKNSMDYHRYFKDWWESDVESMLLRDRNHPSVIMWSIGNEINERADSIGLEIARKMTDYVHATEPTRPVTQAICNFWDHPGRKWPDTAPAFEISDIGSYNYRWQQYEEDHKNYPNRILLGSESVAKEAFENWQLVEKYPWVIGDFIWTGMDYLGETGIGHTVYKVPSDTADEISLMPWPWFNAWCGDVDITGNKKPQSFYRDVVWRESKLEMAVHSPVPKGKLEQVHFWGWPDEEQKWNWPGHEGENLEVSIYSRCQKVRLELNGKLIGEKKITDSSNLTAVFNVNYESGELKAIGFNNDRLIETKSFKTTGPPNSIQLKPERNEIPANRNEIVYVKVEIVDAKGNIVPDADLPVELFITGTGELLAAGNASPNKMASFQKPNFSTFRGRGMAIIRCTGEPGKISIRAKSGNLKPSQVTVKVKPI